MKIDQYKVAWDSKKILRYLYKDFYNSLDKRCKKGKTLEIGAGIGNLSLEQNVIYKIDIQYSRGISIVADAHALPFADNSFENIVMVDVLHHLECPINFLKEAKRVLKDEGRLIMIEPKISFVSWIFYNFFHQEDVDMGWKPDFNCFPNIDKNPYESNQAIPTILFEKYLNLIISLGFKVKENSPISYLAYPLSGGFKSWSLINIRFAKLFLKFEKKLPKFLGKIASFRMIATLEVDKN